MTTNEEVPTLITVLNTPVKVKPASLGNILALWGTTSWMAGRRRPERSWPTRLLVGALSATTLIIADIGHAMAHDEVVKRLNLAMGGTATTAGLVLAARRRWLPGLGLIGAGGTAIGAALGRIR